MIRPEETFKKEEKKLALQAYAAVCGPLALAAVLTAAVLLCFPLSLLSVLILILVWAAGLTAAYLSLQKKLRPYLRLRAYYRTMPKDSCRQIRGTVKALSKDLQQHEGVMMQKIAADAGEKIKTESVDTVLLLPAVFELEIEPGKTLDLEANGNRLTGIDAGKEPAMRLTRGAYAISGLMIFLIILLSSAVWLSLYRWIGLRQEKAAVKVAVCTPAYHEESEKVLQEKAAEKEIDLRFSYSTTLNAETLYQYLVTYASFEADLILLPKTQYDAVFEYETPAFEDPSNGCVLRDPAGKCVAAVIFDPSSEDSETNREAVKDWIAIPSDDAYVLCIGPSGRELAKESAALLLQLLSEDGIFRSAAD